MSTQQNQRQRNVGLPLRNRGVSLGRWFTPEFPLITLSILMCVLIVGLVFVILWSTFQEGLPGFDAVYSLANYKEALFNPNTWVDTYTSIGIGFGTVFFNLLFAVPIAWLVHRTNVTHKNLYVTLMFIVSVVPGFLKAIGWIFLLSPHNGVINEIIRFFIDVERGPLSIYNMQGIAFLQGLSLTPTMFFMVSVAFQKIDIQFEEAGETAGANKRKVLRYITAPLVMPAVFAAAIFNFMTAIAIFEIPALLGGPVQLHTLSTRIYHSVHSDLGLPQYGLAGIYGIIMLIPALITLYYYQKLLKQSHKYSVVTGKGYKPKFNDINKWMWAGKAYIWLYFLLALILPVIVLIWASLIPYITLPTAEIFSKMSFNAYGRAMSILLGDPLLNTVKLTLLASIGVTVLSTIMSWVVLRTNIRGRFAMDTISMLPHAIPNTAFAFALGFIALVLAKVVPLYGSLTIIVIAHIVGFISFGTRTMNGALIQIHSELEHAAHVAGAKSTVAIRKIIIPLIVPSLIYTFIWVAIHSYKETTMAIFLQRPNNVVLSSSIWNLWGASKTAEASAAGVIMIVMIMILIFIMLKIGSRFGFSFKTTK